MKIYDTLLFDLDGTISDPLVGISGSINHALQAHGFDLQAPSRLAGYIGAPLEQIFVSVTGSNSRDLVDALISKYRQRYAETGYSENRLYPGIARVLGDLNKLGIRMAVCTSKRKDFAEKILHMFGISYLFTCISGGDVGIRKQEQIAQLLDTGWVSDATLMIGDRDVDILAAHANGLDGAGVLWGYGSERELLSESPAFLFKSPQDLNVLKSRTKWHNGVSLHRPSAM